MANQLRPRLWNASLRWGLIRHSIMATNPVTKRPPLPQLSKQDKVRLVRLGAARSLVKTKSPGRRRRASSVKPRQPSPFPRIGNDGFFAVDEGFPAFGGVVPKFAIENAKN